MITQNDIDILNFLHNRFVEKYKENPNVDYLIKAREVIGYLQQELVSGVIVSHEQALPIQRVSQQRKLLLDFMTYVSPEAYATHSKAELADNFLSSNSG